MAKTINFCGDSFCNFNTKSKVSWCAQLADKLGVEVVGTGWGGTAYEYAIKSFKHDADITVFCWTDSSRLYHKDYIVNYKSGSRYYKTYKTHEMLSLLGEMFYRTLYNEKYFDELQYRTLYWFDREVLAKYKGIIVHNFCFKNTYTFTHGITSPIILQSNRDLYKGELHGMCHMTVDNNKMYADYVYNLIKDNYNL